MLNMGSVVGFFVGNLDLRLLLPLLHADSELQALSAFVSCCPHRTAHRRACGQTSISTTKPPLRHELHEIYARARSGVVYGRLYVSPPFSPCPGALTLPFPSVSVGLRHTFGTFYSTDPIII
ncbi:hypothetical protein C8R45DRAFT_1100363 [Mycena sanguinolenta]|nr:hypothetical protein C8R45DRAFT_1100363 [Mycena sanguinolenta]